MSTPSIRRRAARLRTGAMLLAAALTAAVASAVPAAAGTVGPAGHITLTAPATAAPGDYAQLEFVYTNTTGASLPSAQVVISFPPSATADVDINGLSWANADPDSYTATVNGDAGARTITAELADVPAGNVTTTDIYLPLTDDSDGPIPLHGVLTENTPGGAVTTPIGDLIINDTPKADLAVTLNASPHGLGITYATFTATVTNNGPATATAAQIRFTYPTGFVLPSATGCTVNATARTATCDLGALASGASTTRTLGLHTGLLTISSHLTVTAARTTSTPTDPQPANDTASATCSALTTLLISC
ncbi:DUF11 domain-containing protein [Streptomyces xanthochromogenes]|uniref:DUF11 domain-containing protein n=1 Tax=Streptomyces xanthochromogenes TaxID=67384 RepID=UPI0038241F27